jgi:predicted PhzF superfamily epimerase YddE/YHI9
VLALPVSLAWARRIFRGRPQSATPNPDHTSRLERIEQAVEAVAIEVERIAEGQRFVTRIMVERPARGAAEEPGSGSLSAATPPLALGAGPIEAIRVPERERARQSIITPH